jgi:uncharacterized membrane protein
MGMPGPILQVARTYNDQIATFRQHLSSEAAKRREHIVNDDTQRQQYDIDSNPGPYSQFYWRYVTKYFCVILGVALFVLIVLLFQNDLKGKACNCSFTLASLSCINNGLVSCTSFE